jgi:hypothetical protein
LAKKNGKTVQNVQNIGKTTVSKISEHEHLQKLVITQKHFQKGNGEKIAQF